MLFSLDMPLAVNDVACTMLGVICAVLCACLIVFFVCVYVFLLKKPYRGRNAYRLEELLPNTFAPLYQPGELMIVLVFIYLCVCF